jgi:biotin transporter BioY
VSRTAEAVALTAGFLALYLLLALVMKWLLDHPRQQHRPPRRRRPHL